MHTETATDDLDFLELSTPTFEAGAKVTYTPHGPSIRVAYVIRQEGAHTLVSTSHPDVAYGTRHWISSFQLSAA